MTTTGILALLSYAVILLGILICSAMQKPKLAGIFKVLLMPSLALFYSCNFPHMALAVLLALGFSWLGDILLLRSSFPFLLAGIGGFAMAHIFYIIHMMAGLLLAPPSMLLLIIVGLVYLLISTALSVYLKDKVRPVLQGASGAIPVYAGLLASLAICAVVFGLSTKSASGWLLIVGANLFMLSDSLLSLELFVRKTRYGDLMVMLTYGLAQLAIIWGFGLL